MSNRAKLVQAGIWLGLFILISFVVNISMFGIQSGFLPTSLGNAEPSPHSEFALTVAATGETVYTSIEDAGGVITEELTEELLSTTYPSPDVATEAASVGEIPGNPAFAHSVNVCTHSDGKVSHQTGAGRHLTRFDGHRDGRHHTDTFHQVLTQNGYQTTDRFHYSVSRNYCGCG